MVAAAMTGSPFHKAGAACALAALLASIGCQTPPPRPPATRRPAKLVTPPLPPPPKAGPEMFASAAIEGLESAETVHYFARRSDGALLVLVRGGRFLARATAPDGTPRGAQATDIGAAPSGPAELQLGALEAVGDGYVLAWAEREDGRTKVATIALDAAGTARGPRVTLTEVGDEVSWLDVLPREGGSLVVWETARGATVDVTAAALSPTGTATGPGVTLLSGVLAWHAAPGGGSLAAVVPPATKGKDKDADDDGVVATGKVVLVPLDAAGKPKAPIEVSAPPTAHPDVHVTEIAGKLVLVWTDAREIDAAVWTAALDRSFAVASPAKRATPPTGEQALVAAVGAEPGAAPVPRGLLAWEDVMRAPLESRQIHLATLGPDGSLGKERATMTFNADSSAPDLSVDAGGFGAVTLARAWQGGPPPEDAPVWPTFVRLGPDLSVLSSEPVRTPAFGPEGVPYLVRGLACRGGACTTLATGGEDEAKAVLVSLVSRKTEWYSPARRDPDDAPPRAASLTALYNGEQISRVAATPTTGGGHLTAWVTYAVQSTAANRKDQNGGAELWLAAVPPGAKAGSVTPIQISKKALSIGGVAAAPSEGDKKEIAIAWVAQERGESQVYITKVDETGKKLAQKKITVVPRPAKKGGVPSEASDVSIAWSGGEGGEGWILTWVDTRDGNAEVYAAKVDRSLTKTIPDRRLTDAPGDAAEPHLAVRGKDTFVAWSDARNNPAEGSGDIYVARLATRSLDKAGPETRLAATPAHSRSPQLVTGPGGAVWLAWVDDAGDAEGASSAVRFAVLDDKGAATTTTSMAGAAGRPFVSAAISCGDKACRGVAAKAEGDALLLDAFTLTPAAQPVPGRTLLTLPGAGSADISPVFADRDGAALFFGADAAAGTGRVRKLQIDW